MSILFSFKNILLIAPHSDDVEFGMGATVSMLSEQGMNVKVIVLSTADESLKKNFPKGSTAIECKQAMKKLKVEPSKVDIHDFPVRYFSDHRQKILEIFFNLQKNMQFDCVFVPALNDVHQDHNVTTTEAIRAFKKISIFGYELLWNQLNAKYDMFVKINEKHLRDKISAINCYESQSHRPYFSSDFISSLAKVRGTQIDTQYAEGFEVIRLIDS